jgi:aspartate/methionine/tyrosine aminotransferase
LADEGAVTLVQDRLHGPSPRLLQVPRVGSRATDETAARLAVSGMQVLDLQAHPTRKLPCHVLDAVAEAAASNAVAPSRGLPVLRQAIADALSMELGRAVDSDSEVLVTAGAMQALDITLATLLSPGEEAVAPVPNFFLDWFFQRQGSRVIGVPCDPHSEYAVDWDRVEQSIGAHTRMIFVTTPANPTGYVLQPADLNALARIAERHNLIVLSDESYDRFVYDGRRHLSPAGDECLAQRTVLIRSFTKSFAMPGWRVGYIVAPRVIIDACLKIYEWVALYGSLVPQAAAAAALRGPHDWLEDIRDEFQTRRDRLVPLLRELGLPVVRPHGGPFVFPDVSGLGTDVAQWLLAEHGIPAVDGALLGGPGHIRLPFGGSDATFEALQSRLREAVREVVVPGVGATPDRL